MTGAGKGIVKYVLIICLMAIIAACAAANNEQTRYNAEPQSQVIDAHPRQAGEAVTVLGDSGVTKCVGDALAGSDRKLRVFPTGKFREALYPWLESESHTTEYLLRLIGREPVSGRLNEMGVRYIVMVSKPFLLKPNTAQISATVFDVKRRTADNSFSAEAEEVTDSQAIGNVVLAVPLIIIWGVIGMPPVSAGGINNSVSGLNACAPLANRLTRYFAGDKYVGD